MPDDSVAADELGTLGIREILDADSRVCFVLDLDPDEELPNTTTIQPSFCNQALRLHERLLDAILGRDAGGNKKDGDPKYLEFRNWTTGVTKFDDSKDVFPQSFMFCDLLWTGSTVRQRWRLVSGNLLWKEKDPPGDLSSGPPVEKSTGESRNDNTAQKLASQTTIVSVAEESGPTGSTTLVTKTSQKPSYFPKPAKEAGGSSDNTSVSSQSKNSLFLAAPDKAVTDWTADNPRGLLNEQQVLARTINWAATPLGPMESWSPEFRQAANLVLANPHPAALFWGSDLTMLYNTAYAQEVAGNKHPSLMGTGFSGPFAELWDAVAPVFAECARTGVSIRRDDDYLPIERRGLLEETFFSWSWTPLYGGTKRILGFYNAPFETTHAVIDARRMHTIKQLGESAAHVKTVKQFWKAVISGLEDNEKDVPFALLYSIGESEEADHSSTSSGSTISLKSCFYEGSIGIPEGHPAAPLQLDLKRSREGFVPSFREAMRTREPTLLRTRDGSLPEALLEGIDWRGFGDPCREAIIFPVRPTNGENVLAFLLLGVNPRRPYDVHYTSFTNMLNRQLATSLASVILFEEEVRRSKDAAEAYVLEQEQLTQQLAIQTSRLRRMTELSPLGMFLISPDGILQEANERYYEMTGLPRSDAEELSWMNCVMESSRETLESGWKRLTVERLPWSDELQLKKTTTRPMPSQSEPMEHWCLFTAQPEFGSGGSLRSIMGSITDISHLKWAQGLQDQRLREAEETRRQQNEFIDITSHEMRNPLTAILQSAEDISTTLDECRTKAIVPSIDVVESCLDAANTISLCVQHQKSIVDDILTISKLDSNLLVITPIASQPIAVAQRAVKMFDSELKAKNIKMVFDIEPSVAELELNYVTLDPSRILQVLINLMTNAIKFTASSKTRVITISLSAHLETPTSGLLVKPDFKYIPPRATTTKDVTLGEEWGSGQKMYLRFQVEDTGVGLTNEGMKVLFERFSQATPRTHAQYGGSGLGLFISRQLSELHGGQIGVSSIDGQGSTFGFYIATRRSGPPQTPTPRDEFLPNEQISVPIASDTPLNIRQAPQRTTSHDSAAQSSPAILSLPSPIDSPRPSSTPVPPGAFDTSLLSVLIVEDNLINQRVLAKQLLKHTRTVHIANDGLECLSFLATTHFQHSTGVPLSVILMDLEMPNMDGLTCVRHIRQMESEGRIKHHVPVLAVTANVRGEQVDKARGAGMDGVVRKPFRIGDLFKEIEKVLNHGRSGMEIGDGDR